MIHVALVSAYPTEAEARATIEAMPTRPGRWARHMDPASVPYLGIWHLPEPFGSAVHLFGQRTDAELEAAGWTRQEQP